jgi:hypothetical protein
MVPTLGLPENFFSNLACSALGALPPPVEAKNHSVKLADRSAGSAPSRWPGSLFPSRQGVANFLQQLDFARRRRLGSRFLLLLAAKPVHGFHRHEEHEGHN